MWSYVVNMERLTQNNLAFINIEVLRFSLILNHVISTLILGKVYYFAWWITRLVKGMVIDWISTYLLIQKIETTVWTYFVLIHNWSLSRSLHPVNENNFKEFSCSTNSIRSRLEDVFELFLCFSTNKLTVNTKMYL